MEDGAGGDQDRGVDEQGEAERGIGIADIRLDRLALGPAVECAAGRREQAAVQVEVMRHHGRADDADAEQQHGRVGDELRRRQQAGGDLRPDRLGEPQQRNEAGGDDQDQDADQAAQPPPVVAADHQEDQRAAARSAGRRERGRCRTGVSARSRRPPARPGRSSPWRSRPTATASARRAANRPRANTRPGSCRWRSPGARTAPARPWRSGWRSTPSTAARSRSVTRRRDRSPSCRDRYSRPRSAGRARPCRRAAASRETRAGGSERQAMSPSRRPAMAKPPWLVCSNVVMAIRLLQRDAPAHSGMISGLLLGNLAIVAGSTFRVWATISGGVCASQSDSEMSAK